MNRHKISKGFQEGLMAARIKDTFMLQVLLEGRNSYWVEKESQQLNVWVVYASHGKYLVADFRIGVNVQL